MGCLGALPVGPDQPVAYARYRVIATIDQTLLRDPYWPGGAGHLHDRRFHATYCETDPSGNEILGVHKIDREDATGIMANVIIYRRSIRRVLVAQGSARISARFCPHGGLRPRLLHTFMSIFASRFENFECSRNLLNDSRSSGKTPAVPSGFRKKSSERVGLKFGEIDEETCGQ